MTFPSMIPSLPPPPGEASDFGHPSPLLKWNIVCTVVCLSITTITFVLRLWVRLGVLQQWILEDYMCCVSYIGLVMFCALMNITFKRHGGVHQWNLTLTESYEPIYWINIASIEYAPAILCTKLTILLLYRRVFLPLRWGLFDTVLRVFMVVCSIYYLSAIPVKTWQCIPRAKIWNKSLEGKCIYIPGMLNANGLFNTLSDLLILLVPIKALWNLQMKNSKKIGIALLFTVGLIAPIFSLVGWVIRLRQGSSHDITYNHPELLLWGAAELSAGVTCTCLPTLPALRPGYRRRTLERHFPSMDLPNIKRKQPTSLSISDIFDEEPSQLSESDLQYESIEKPSPVVTTDIEGGLFRGVRATSCSDLGGKQDEVVQSSIILKTVVVE